MSGIWARFEDVHLVPSEPIDLDERPAFRQACADGIERGFAGELPPLPDGAETYLIHAADDEVGLLVLVRDCPVSGDVAVVALAIDPEARGSAFATKALIAAERRLTADGARRVVTRVPRTNGRGLYFMLRAGLTPSNICPDDATWFIRGGSR